MEDQEQVVCLKKDGLERAHGNEVDSCKTLSSDVEMFRRVLGLCTLPTGLLQHKVHLFGFSQGMVGRAADLQHGRKVFDTPKDSKGHCLVMATHLFGYDSPLGGLEQEDWGYSTHVWARSPHQGGCKSHQGPL